MGDLYPWARVASLDFVVGKTSTGLTNDGWWKSLAVRPCGEDLPMIVAVGQNSRHEENDVRHPLDHPAERLEVLQAG